MSIDELYKKLRQNNEIGELAEVYAQEYEKTRLKERGIDKEPLRVSEFDVMAGYDMVSFENVSSSIFKNLSIFFRIDFSILEKS